MKTADALLRQRGISRAMIIGLLVIVGSANAQEASTSSDELFLFKPDSPSRLVKGAILAERLERSSLASGYLSELLASQPSRDTLLALRNEFGMRAFQKLSAVEDLQPASSNLLKLINEASYEERPDSAAVSVLIGQLGQDSTQTKEAPLRILAAENDAVEPLLTADQGSDQGRVASAILNKFPRRFRYGLIDALRSSDEDQQVRILKLISKSADASLIPELWGTTFSSQESVAEAARTAIHQLNGSIAGTASKQDVVDRLLQHISELLRKAHRRYPNTAESREDRLLADRFFGARTERPYGAGLLKYAVRLGQHVLEIAPDDIECAAALRVAEGADQSWPVRWGNHGESTDDSAVLATASLALASATEASGAVMGLLAGPHAEAILKENRPILNSLLVSSDARVRLSAAAKARAAGVNHRLVDFVLDAAKEASTDAAAVVIDSRNGESLNTAAVLETSRDQAAADRLRNRDGVLPTDVTMALELGMPIDQYLESKANPESMLNQRYVVEPLTSGATGFEAATRVMQCELIAVHSNCLNWPLSTTIANLRTDPRTRNVPVVIYGEKRDRQRIRFLQERYQGVYFLPAPLSEITFADAARLAGVPKPLLSSAERSEMITFAQAID